MVLQTIFALSFVVSRADFGAGRRPKGKKTWFRKLSFWYGFLGKLIVREAAQRILGWGRIVEAKTAHAPCSEMRTLSQGVEKSKVAA